MIFEAGGHKWDLSISVYGVKRVRDALDIDLIESINDGFIESLVGNPIKLCDVIYVLAEDQCKEHGMSDVDFGKMLAGDAIEHAAKAFVESLIDFFPKPKGDLLRKAMAKFEMVEKKALEVANQIVDEIDVDQELEKVLKRGSAVTGDSSGNSPG